MKGSIIMAQRPFDLIPEVPPEILEVPGRFWRFLGEVCKGRAAAAHICSRARPAPGGSGGAPEGVAAPMCLRATMKRQLKWLWSIEN